MAFEKAKTKNPSSIGPITVTLYIDADGNLGANYDCQILDADGGRMRVKGDIGNLLPQLTETQNNQLAIFMETLRAKAEAEFLAS